ncbi:MAG: EAL domain-containing protein [Sulfurospirillum sp.]|nr:EAL domain-containing protein [Sulfurospirillum sp.]
MIIPVGALVLEQACKDMVKLKKEFGFDGKMCVNVSGIQIEHSDFFKKLCETIELTGIQPHNLEIEITESVIMYDPQRWIKLLGEIKAMGIHIAIDDFGTGYSSLSYLRKLPVDKLKIDISFVQDLPFEEDACSIANSIINLSDNMRMITLAEGIETQEQADYLRLNHCEEAQGYLFAKPMNLNALYAWIQDR